MEDFEQQKKGIFDLIHSWDNKNIRLASLIWESNPELKEAVFQEFKEILYSKDYKDLSGLRVLANINDADLYAYEEDYSAFYATKIRWLKINHTNFNLFPYLYLKNLENLKIISAAITTLPPDIGQLKALTQLDLDGCRNLRTLPLEIKNLTALEKFKIGGSVLASQYKTSKLEGNQQIQDFFDRVLEEQK